MGKTYDTVVIGAGVFGAWTALTLKRAGQAVALLDAYGPANSRASSGGESRIMRTGYGADEIYTRWAAHSLALWREFCGVVAPPLFQVTRQVVFFFGVEAGDRRFGARAMPAWIDFTELVYGLPDLEDRGVKLAIDRHGPTFDPEAGERVVTAEGLAEVRRHLARRLPALGSAPVVETRLCHSEN